MHRLLYFQRRYRMYMTISQQLWVWIVHHQQWRELLLSSIWVSKRQAQSSLPRLPDTLEQLTMALPTTFKNHVQAKVLQQATTWIVTVIPTIVHKRTKRIQSKKLLYL